MEGSGCNTLVGVYCAATPLRSPIRSHYECMKDTRLYTLLYALLPYSIRYATISWCLVQSKQLLLEPHPVLIHVFCQARALLTPSRLQLARLPGIEGKRHAPPPPQIVLEVFPIVAHHLRLPCRVCAPGKQRHFVHGLRPRHKRLVARCLLHAATTAAATRPLPCASAVYALGSPAGGGGRRCGRRHVLRASRVVTQRLDECLRG